MSEESNLEEIDWNDEKTAKLKSFLLNHKAVMMHCDEETKVYGLCECMHALAEWWGEQQLKLEDLQEQISVLKKDEKV